MWLEITAFDGVSLSGTGASPARSMVAMSESAPVVSRVGYLENGAKFDADGTADSDVALGQVIARYQLLAYTGVTGMTGLNTQVVNFTGKRGHVGTLTGISRGSSGDTTYQCTARLVDVTEEDMTVVNVPGGTGKGYAYVTVTWEKKTEWAQV
jgi:hypothetical protein